MKKITLTLLFLAITTLVHAQIEEAIGRFPFDETISYDSFEGSETY